MGTDFNAGIPAFLEQVRQALNHLDEPEWLGAQSPLAAPYFLGDRLPDRPDAAARGRTLRATLGEAADAMWPDALPADHEALLPAVNAERQAQGNKGPRYLFLLLDLRYFRRFFRPLQAPTAGNDVAVCDFLSISRASYFNHLKAAQGMLAERLLTRVRPTLRLEQPVLAAGPLVGRETLLAQCAAELGTGRPVALTGPGGVGKTTLGAAVARRWPVQPVFWYTLRPTFNDRLDCLLFSLGYFLHRQGASGLWRQLIADGGRIDNPDLALAQARGDLTRLDAPPLLCVDELDVLQPAADTLSPHQLQIREFLDGLQQVAPLLLLGQQPAPGIDTQYVVDRLALADTAALFQLAGLQPAPAALQQVQAYTGGNPRLLQLCLAVHRTGLPLAEVCARLPRTPALQAVWSRLWQRLEPEERGLLQQLAVFRSPAPADGWDAAALTALAAHHVVQQDGFGGLSLLPAVRDLLAADRQRFPAETREQCHLAAAGVREARGEVTAAAHHFREAGQAPQAVQVWFPHRGREIGRGHASTALALFQEISARQLPRPEREALAVLRAELFQLRGDAGAGLSELNAVRWRGDSELGADAALLQGAFLNALGYPHRALARHEEGVALTSRLLNRMVRFRTGRGIVHVQQKALDEAWQEAVLARYEATHLQGVVQDEQGNYQEAERLFQAALALAEQARFEPGVARTHREMAKTYGRQARLAEALHHARAAIRTFERLGDELSRQKMRSTLAATYFQAGEFEAAIGAAEPTVAFFTAARMPFWAAVTAATLAEAYYETGRLEQAWQTAQQALRQEESQAQPYALHTLGLVARARAAYDEAEAYLVQSRQLAAANGDRYMAAYAWRALGELYLAQNRPDAARGALDTAARAFDELGLEQEAATARRLRS